MKIEIKHIAPYLPYGVRIRRMSDHGYPIRDFTLQGLSTNGCYGEEGIVPVEFKKCKPILRSLSDLTKEIEHNGERFVPGDKLINLRFKKTPVEHWGDVCHDGSVGLEDMEFIMSRLYEWHFDIEGLIDQGLAIDKNTI